MASLFPMIDVGLTTAWVKSEYDHFFPPTRVFVDFVDYDLAEENNSLEHQLIPHFLEKGKGAYNIIRTSLKGTPAAEAKRRMEYLNRGYDLAFGGENISEVFAKLRKQAVIDMTPTESEMKAFYDKVDEAAARKDYGPRCETEIKVHVDLLRKVKGSITNCATDMGSFYDIGDKVRDNIGAAIVSE